NARDAVDAFLQVLRLVQGGAEPLRHFGAHLAHDLERGAGRALRRGEPDIQPSLQHTLRCAEPLNLFALPGLQHRCFHWNPSFVCPWPQSRSDDWRDAVEPATSLQRTASCQWPGLFTVVRRERAEVAADSGRTD